MKFRTLSTVLMAVAFLLLLTGGQVVAQDNMNGMLRGSYAFNETLVCAQAKADAEGMFPPLPHFVEAAPGVYQLLVEGETSTMANSGVVQFDGDGSMTETAMTLGIFHDRVSVGAFPAMSQPPTSCQGDYTVHPDRTVEVVLTCTQQIPGDIPLTATLGPFTYPGYLGADPRTVVLSIVTPSLGTLTVVAPDDSVVTAYEALCVSTQTLVRIDSDPTYIAQFGNGTGVMSEVVLTNPSTSASVSGTLQFADDTGDPMPVGIVGETSPTSSVDFSIPSLGSTMIATDGQGEVQVGSATATSDSDIGAVVRFTLPDIGITGVGASEALTGFIVPAQRQTGGISTALAVHNPDAEPVSVNLSLRDEAGEEIDTGTIDNLPGKGHIAMFIFELFDDVPDPFVGTIVAQTTTGRVAATALELDAGAGTFTTLPVTPLQ